MSAKLDALIPEVHRLFAEALEYAASEAYRREVKGGIPEGYPEELEHIALAVAAAVESKDGISRKRALEIGFGASERVAREFGGQKRFGGRVYIPKNAENDAKGKAKAIFEEWKRGAKVVDLARKHGVSEVWVYSIINRHRGQQGKG